MTTGESLHRAILLHPDDDDRRLVYADWLEENGRPEQAEFIRVQLELWVEEASQGTPAFWTVLRRKHRLCHGCSRWCRLYHRERELLAHPAVCVATTINAPGLSLRQPEGIRRGFVEAVTCTCPDWLNHGPAIVAAVPVREVMLADREPVGPLAFLVRGIYRDVWSWDRREQQTHAENIPACLFDLLRGGTPARGGDVKAFDVPDAARSALSAAAILWARREAKLDVRCEVCKDSGWKNYCPVCGGTGWRPAAC